ncbi:hypothetical protein AJ80_00303 [Polytolypa hystricis UAMH7299]|uniref:t-SNARE coiled-coil homology domain-containing protein n=1 Tax=Polytolypa hystricis (strain UAMH7299) TaxID=1447883 RepID=A0A2B7Z4J8_POLH7|nr:hypothetical protein AJ80_00303 [Polytolypa hystricis UAMH7299]
MSNQGYGNSQEYGQYNPYNGARYGDVENQGPYEMTTMQDQNQGYAQPARQNDILDQCRDVDEGVNAVESNLQQINILYRRLLSDADPSREHALRAEADEMASQTKNLYRNLIERMKVIKQSPDAGSQRNAPQIGRVERRLKQAITTYQKVQTDFRKGLEQQMARQYRIVRPDATDAEVQEAVQDTSNQQIFSQALIQSDRRGDAQKVSQMVRARHEEIQKIERDFVELAQMFQDLDNLVVQQEAPVVRIDEGAEEATTNVVKANEEIKGAIDKARARNRKKWWCVLICLLIIIVIAVVIAVVVVVTRK